MKFHELPPVAQEAACEVMKTILNKTLDKEPALELARTINAVFTELYFPSGKEGGKSPDEIYKEQRDAALSLATWVKSVISYSDAVLNDPTIREPYQEILNKALESAARVHQVFDHHPEDL